MAEHILTTLLLSFAILNNISNAEHDFNFNDSQITLFEPKKQLVSSALLKSNENYEEELSLCNGMDRRIYLSLVLQSLDWENMGANRQTILLDKLSNFFAIPKTFIALESVNKLDFNEMYKEAIHKGNNKCKRNNHPLGRVSFLIGCGSSYFSTGKPVAYQIDNQMKDKSIENIIGEKFGWWVIWRKPLAMITRMRRQVEGSGENYEYDDDYDYEDEPIDVETEIPNVPSINSSSSNISSHTTATTSFVTTTVANIETSTSTHPHRHHHGQQEVETTLPTDQVQQTAMSSTLKQTFDIMETTILPLSTITAINISENIESVVENMSPMIKTRLQKFAMTSGKLFSYFVPEDTFIDQEDKANLRLQFTDKNGDEVSSQSWLQFNAETHEIYGMPLEDSVSRWHYRLSATDSGNETVSETVELTVQQHRGLRSVNHEIMIVVKLLEIPIRNIDWQVKLVKAIASALRDNSTNAIVVREIRVTANDPTTVSFIYFNETLPHSFCPETELTTLIKSLQSSNLQQLVNGSMIVKEISGQLIGSCLKTQQPPRPKPTLTLIKHAPPQPRNQVDRVNATAGHLLIYKVPSDTFYDDYDLKLTLRTRENNELPPRHWLQFDSKNQEFFGIPKSIDTGTEEYLLVAENTLGLTANDALVVVVNHAVKREYIVFFKAYLGIRHEQFNAELQRKFVERLAAFFGDLDTRYIQVRSVTTQHDADSTIVNFYNTTLYKSHHHCPEQQVEMLRSLYLLSDNTVRDRVKQALGAELNLTNLQIHNLGSCHGHADVPHREFPTAKFEIPSESTFGDNYMITVIYPAVIIIIMIMIATLIACCVHKRRHKSGKMELGDEEERKSFRTRGIPVIFQDELDEKPELGNKSPIILKNEKPPLLPPTYTMNGEHDLDEYVPPPAVVLGGREVRGKSPATPSYRKPPPYVSP